MNAYSTTSSCSILTLIGRALVVAALGCSISACDLGDENLGEGGGGMCEIPDDPQPPEPPTPEQATVRITNATVGPIWLPGQDCPGATQFRLTVDGTEYVNRAQERLLCSTAYDSLRDKFWCGGLIGCEGGGGIGETVRIGAGESYEVPWGGYAFTREPFGTLCYAPGGGCGGMESCYAGRQLELGSSVSVRVEANGKCTYFGGQLCDCEDPDEETCVLSSGEQSFVGPELVGTVDFELADGVVEVVITE